MGKFKELLAEKGKLRHFIRGFESLAKWVVISVTLGTVIGTIAAGFLYAIGFVTEFRLSHSFMVLFLPLGGCLIVFLYQVFKKSDDTGTSQVLQSIREGNKIKIYLAPLILISTVITHAFGGSVGREGAALQFGGSIGNFLGEKLRLSKDTVKIITMAGMAGAFASLFGTPLGAAIFAIEVSMIGIMHYSALVPCILTAYFSHYITILWGMQKVHVPHPVTVVPSMYSHNVYFAILLGVISAMAGICFILVMKYTHKLYHKFFKNAYVRVIVGGILVAFLASLLHTQDYIGLGENVIHSAFEEPAVWYAFLLKMIFTALTLEAGFKGGEIVPTLFIGATLGSMIAPLINMPIGLCAACGMIGMFVAVTNTPIASLVLALEMFGHEGIPYFAVVIAVSYLISGYFSLYNAQQITFSKYTLSDHIRKNKE